MRTTVDLIRHGQPEGGQRFRGNGVDDPLSGLGWSQMRASVARVTGWDLVVSSPMQRCQAFAQWLAAERGLPLAHEPDLREVGFGTWEGRERSALCADPASGYDAFYRDPVHARPHGAEELGAFAARVTGVYERLLRQHAGRHILLVAHAGVIRAVFGHVTQAPPVNWYRTQVDNAAITRCVHDAHGHKLVRHNWLPDFA